MTDRDCADELLDAVRGAYVDGTPLHIRGQGSKDFYGRAVAPTAAPLDMGRHAGIVDYDPSDLVITARAGTSILELDQLLGEQAQMIGFEPPRYGGRGTLGGAIAAGLSGPRRPYAGSARDFVLGVQFINGRGEVIEAGGRVIKNVAGYDLSRLMAGALGTLGLITQVSLRVVPRPAIEMTLREALPLAEVPAWMSALARRPLPLSALIWLDGCVYLRLTGTTAGVEEARDRLGLDILDDDVVFWHGIRDQTLSFFTQGDEPLWRLSHRPAAPVADLPGQWMIDWGGAQRWLRSSAPESRIRAVAAAQGGHATCFRGGDRTGAVFHPVGGPLLDIHRRVKKALDPRGIFNPGRLSPDW